MSDPSGLQSRGLLLPIRSWTALATTCGEYLAIAQTKYAGLLMVTGDPRHAAVVGHQALDAVVNLNSPRAADDLRTSDGWAIGP